MKTRWMHLTAGFTMFVLCISMCTTTSSATIVWQDDFSDPNLPGWTIFGYENSTSQVTTEGNFSAADGTLRVLDDDRNVARHESDVTVGSWCFDLFVEDDGDGWFYVGFMSNGTRPFPAFASTFVAVGPYMYDGDILAWEVFGTDYNVHSFINMDPLQGWHSIKVNRTSNDYYEIYINRTLRGFFDSDEVTSSTYFEIACNNASGCAIDNLYVSDDPNFEPTTPTTPPPGDFPWILVAVAGGVAIGVIVVAVVFLRRR